MDDLLSTYRARFNLNRARFLRIDHGDTMIAVVYKVERPSSTPLILKICPREQDYHHEIHALNLLSGQMLLPAVIDTHAPTIDIPGAILMECQEGHPLASEDWNDRLAYSLGTYLAQLHQHRTEAYGKLAPLDTPFESARTYFETKFTEELEECTGHLPDTLIKRCERYLSLCGHKLDAVDGPCIIHRDFRPANIMVHNGALTGVIDWASSRSGFAEQDFCPMEHGQWIANTEHRTAFLNGYASIRPVPNFPPLTPLLRLGRSLAIIGFCVKSDTWKSRNRDIYSMNRRFLEEFAFL